jgi:uncharacterized protein with gpF-like domain
MPDPAPDLAYACRLPPQDAIAYLESKGYAIGFSWTDVWQEAHAKAFTRRRGDEDRDPRRSQGRSRRRVKKRHDAAGLSSEFDAAPAAQGLVGAPTRRWTKSPGEMAGKGLTPRRLATIFDTNLQSAYMAGRYKAFLANVADRPYWQYVAGDGQPHAAGTRRPERAHVPLR